MLNRGFRRRLYQLISIILLITMLTECSPLVAGPDRRPKPSPAPAATGMRSLQASKSQVNDQPQPVPHPPPLSGSLAAIATPRPAGRAHPGLAAAIIQPPPVAYAAAPERVASSPGSPASRPVLPRLASGALAANIPLVPGWNLISIPEEPADTDPAAVLASIAGSYNLVYAYAGCDDADPWKLYDPAAPPPANDLVAIDHKIGFWIEMTADATLTVDGTQPTSTNIQLCQGWNLIGYPLDKALPVPTALASIAGKYTHVFAFDPNDAVDPWEIYSVDRPAWANELQTMDPGRGFWVYATEDVTLTIAEPPPTPTPTATPTVTPTPTPTRVPVGRPPTANISSPAEGTEVTDFVDIVGTADDPDGDLAEYQLQYRMVDTAETEWATFATGTTPVVNGVLGSLDPTLMLNGMFEVRVLAIDSEGQQTAASVHLVLTGQQKIGHFTLTFTDIAIPVAGLDVTVLRHYDSRDKRVGDFGVGWSMALTNLQLAENRIPGEDWEQTISGDFVPTYCVEPTQLHLVTVAFPGGKVHRFAPTVSPHCQGLIPIQYATIEYVALPGTYSRLEPLGGTDVVVFGGAGGPVELRDLDLNLYDPNSYRLTTRDGITYLIDQTDGVQRITDPNGNTLTFSPNNITHSTGKSVAFQRDGLGRITRITDPMGRSLVYDYDASGDLVGVTDREENETTFTYDGNHRLLEIFDPLGRRPARNEYDADGRLIAVIDANNNRVEFDHDLAGRVETVTDRLGNRTVVEYDQRGNVLTETDALGNTSRYTYDVNGNRLTTTDPYGNITSWTYNAQGDVLSTTDPLGNTTTFSYDSAGRLLTRTDPLGHTITNVYDAKGNLTSSTDALGRTSCFEYSADGNLARQVDPLGNRTSFFYDQYGAPIKAIDAMGNISHVAYDANGNAVSQTFNHTTAYGPQTSVTLNSYDAEGALVSRTDPNGHAFYNTFNPLGQIEQSVDRNGNVVQTRYDDTGLPGALTLPDGMTLSHTYDAEGRPIVSTDPNGNLLTTAYDPVGRPIQTTMSDGAMVAQTFDALGRQTTFTNENGHTITIEYDAAGRQTRVNRYGVSTQSGYDAAGNLTSVTDHNGRITRYQYNAANELARVTYADGSTREAGYDAGGRKI